MKARLGKAEGITATAHKLARILYTMITKRVSYSEQEAMRLPAKTKANRLKNLARQAQTLDFQLIPSQQLNP